jgi:hypothetical protein
MGSLIVGYWLDKAEHGYSNDDTKQMARPPHEELLRYQKEGLLPLRRFA